MKPFFILLGYVLASLVLWVLILAPIYAVARR